MIKYILFFIASYFIGNISGAVLLSKIFFHQDIRDFGSGNAGTTNAIRVYGMKYGVAAFVIDFLKGYAVCFIARYFLGDIGVLCCGIAVVLGHDFPAILGFRGGKGIATSFGVFMLASPGIVLMMFTFFLVVSIVSKYVSLGSVCAALAGIFAGIYHIFYKNLPIGCLYVFLALLSLYQHRGNIKRLLKGEESKFSVKK